MKTKKKPGRRRSPPLKRGHLRRDRELESIAREVRSQAYAPYSKFLVGAALRGASGRIYTGVNVENRSFGLTICAERNAISSAVAAGERDFVAIAIATDTVPPSPPCGACREVMAEFNAAMDVTLIGAAGSVQRLDLLQLLPLRFEFKPRR